jgi:hypothetical protein
MTAEYDSALPNTLVDDRLLTPISSLVAYNEGHVQCATIVVRYDQSLVTQGVSEAIQPMNPARMSDLPLVRLVIYDIGIRPGLCFCTMCLYPKPSW